jgi:hypothetical protein
MTLVARYDRWVAVAPIATVAIFAGFFAYIRLAPRQTPAGQPALVQLTPEGLHSLVDVFNAQRDRARLLVLLSPTSGACRQGASAIQSLAAEVPGSLSIFVVWEPVIKTDIGPPMTRTLERISDPRAVQFWDPHRLVSAALLQALRAVPWRLEPDLTQSTVVSDFVGVYPAGTEWTGALPFPAYLTVPVARQIDGVRQVLRTLAQHSFEDGRHHVPPGEYRTANAARCFAHSL